ncbi:sensor histidine kinase [Halobacillus salinus]|uniref:histidine kinase n=2 Tax=Halobacillus salinus TaxID=192814 RepID=A0A4Z0GUW8_9BACI|nr:sensor histidine kinase [Halobacillus salinus]
MKLDNLGMIRLVMFYLISCVYYLNLPDTPFYTTIVILAVLGFTATHFTLNSSFGEKRLPYILAVDFAIIFTLGMLDVDSTLYLILFGVEAVTLLLFENRKQVLLPYAAAFLIIFSTINVFAFQAAGQFYLFDNLISGAFVVFCAIVGRLIYRLTEAQETVSTQYKELKEAHEQLKQYSEQVEELTAIEERNRISREIHDTVGHKMTALLMQLQVAKELQAADPAKSTSALRVSEGLAREALHETRMSVRALQDDAGDPRSFVTKVREMLQEYEDQTGLASTLNVEGDGSNIPPSVQWSLTRLVQESLTNAVKHGGAKTCEVDLAITNEHVAMHITDDGKGAGDVQPGFGIKNMRERVQEHGGTLTFETNPNQGFTIQAEFPLKRMTWRVGGVRD